MEVRLLGQNRVGSVRVSLKAAGCVLLRLRLDTLSKRAVWIVGSNRTLGQASRFMGRGRACARPFGP